MEKMYVERITPTLTLFALTTASPSDEEWQATLEVAETSPTDVPWRTLVITDGASQRSSSAKSWMPS